MSIIILSGEAFSGGDDLAVGLARSLGYRYVDDAVIIEKAAAWGLSQPRVRRALEKPTKSPLWRAQEERTCLTVIRAALADELRTGAIVYYGDAAHLLAKEGDPFLRVRIIAPLDVRTRLVCSRLRYAPREALNFIRKSDRQKRLWLRNVNAIFEAKPDTPDLIVNLEHLDWSDTVHMIRDIAGRREYLTAVAKQQEIMDTLAVASRLEASLALDPVTAGLDVRAVAENGSVSVTGKVSNADELSDIRRVAAQISGVTDIRLDQIELARSGLGPFIRSLIAHAGNAAHVLPGLRPAWLLPSLILSFLLIYVFWVTVFGRGGVRAFAGVVTDTDCGARHGGMQASSDIECVRTCVKFNPDVKYALYDGKHLYTLTDQRSLEKFAGQQVRIRGFLDEKTNILTIWSISGA